MSNTINYLLNYFQNLFSLLLSASDNIISAGVIFLFFWLLRKRLVTIVFGLISKFFPNKTRGLGQKILLVFEYPLRCFFVILGLYAAVGCFALPVTQQLFITKLFRSIIIVLITWGLYNLQDVNSILFKKFQEKTKINIDQILFPFLSKAFRIITILVAFTIIVQEWNYDINGLIAGLGLGGLALALAAQNSLANIFGGMVIILDKPFSLDDYITTPSVEGIVEDINFRSTKVRTLDHALVTVPNSTLANESILNWSKREKRLITFNLGISYITPKDKIESCVSKIRLLLENHPGIYTDSIYATFDSFGESSLNIFLYFSTKTNIWGEYLILKEEINLKLLQILEEEEVDLALPSRRLYCANEFEFPGVQNVPSKPLAAKTNSVKETTPE